MKKVLLTLTLVGAVSAAFAQGTVNFTQLAIYRLSIGTATDAGVLAGTRASMPLTAGLFNFGLFYQAGGSDNMQLVDTKIGVNSTSSAGIIASPVDNRTALNTIQIPGSVAGDTTVWLKAAGWSSSFGASLAGYNAAKAAFLAGGTGFYFGENAAQNVAALGPTAGPGISIWEATTGTNAKLLNAFALYANVPEPSSLALLGLGGAAMMIFRRRK